MYVTGYENEQGYYDDKGYSGAEEANDNMELTWEQYLEDYEGEEEVVINKITYKSDLIKMVNFSEKPHKKLIKLLNKLDIPYELNESKINESPDTLMSSSYMELNSKNGQAFGYFKETGKFYMSKIGERHTEMLDADEYDDDINWENFDHDITRRDF
jgi:hypothetical protein